VMAPSTRMTRIYRRERLVVDVEEAGLPLEVGLRREMYLPRREDNASERLQNIVT
jgi:hypothetical protein